MLSCLWLMVGPDACYKMEMKKRFYLSVSALIYLMICVLMIDIYIKKWRLVLLDQWLVLLWPFLIVLSNFWRSNYKLRILKVLSMQVENMSPQWVFLNECINIVLIYNQSSIKVSLIVVSEQSALKGLVAFIVVWALPWWEILLVTLLTLVNIMPDIEILWT